MGDEPVDVLFGAREIAVPEEHGDAPIYNNRCRYRMANGFGVRDRLVDQIDGLNRMALLPEGSCQGGTSPKAVIETKINRVDLPEARLSFYCCFKLEPRAS
jgi:hypothetical protein